LPKDEDAINILKKAILLETDPEPEAALKKKLEALQAVPPPLPAKKSDKRRNILIGPRIIFGIVILSISPLRRRRPKLPQLRRLLQLQRQQRQLSRPLLPNCRRLLRRNLHPHQLLIERSTL
jgi:hypothetical protein